MTKQMSDQDKYLHENRAWRWQWPNERNCWSGKSQRKGPKMTYSGPSKRTVAKRAARRAAKRSH